MELADVVLAGNTRALSRAATLIEAQTEQGRDVSRRLFLHSGRALTVGVTGAPGVGKSTLVNCLIAAYRGQGKSIGVVAVDPSSPYSGGALLGDRVRMLEHYSDPGVFIRSMASRGRLGGMAATTLDLVLMLDAAGRQVVLIETVGVGQDEVDVAHLADVTLVVLAPGAGDDIQALKAGILEIADIIVINKADLAGADVLYDQIVDAQRLLDPQVLVYAPVCRVSAGSRAGIDDLLLHIAAAAEKKRGSARAIQTWIHRLRQKLRDDLMTNLPPQLIEKHAQMVSEKMEDPDSAIMALKVELLEYGSHQERD